MKTTLTQFDILDWMHGCAIGSHLRQGIWRRAVDEFYAKLTPQQRLAVYTYAKRDLTPVFLPHTVGGKEFPHAGHDDFFRFLARYNPANQYLVHAKDELEDITVEAYRYKGNYYVSFYQFVAKDAITYVQPAGTYELCGLACMWHAHCARYNSGNATNIGLYPTARCDWFINAQSDHGADLKHFEI